MKALSRLLVSSLLVGAVALTSSSAHAQSTRGAGYVQGNVLGYSLVGAGGFSLGGYPIDLHAGYHLGGTHEGFVIGATQKFVFATGFIAGTLARAGYDIAIPIKNGEMELTIAPYGQIGALYGDNGGRFAFGLGAEGRFFPLNEGAGKGFFATAKPFELTFAPGSGGLLWLYTFNAGAGYAF